VTEFKHINRLSEMKIMSSYFKIIGVFEQ
jgi:hypothetical protein